MDDLPDCTISDEELKKFERIYFDQINNQTASAKGQFDYAVCLVRSKFPVDINKGIFLLEDLCSQDPSGKRNYLYYLAVGHSRMKEYSKALKYCRAFLEIEPFNPQVQELERNIKGKIDREGKIGLAITLAGVVAMGGLACLAFLKTRKDNF